MILDRRFRPLESGDSDQELMAEVGAGNVEAFGQLYDRFCNRAYSVAFAVSGDKGRAQDAVQEAFLTIWKNRTSYRPDRGNVAAWLLTVVRYRAIDLVRRNDDHCIHWVSDDLLEERPGPDDVCATVVERDSANRLWASLDRLPEEQRRVITLAYYGQLTHTEIAHELGLPSGTVKGRMRLGLQKLRTGMEQAVGDTAAHARQHRSMFDERV